MMALAVVALLHYGGGRAMSTVQKALKFAMRPLLNERHRTGLSEGRTEERREWEEWLQRQRSAGATLIDNDPPPSA